MWAPVKIHIGLFQISVYPCGRRVLLFLPLILIIAQKYHQYFINLPFLPHKTNQNPPQSTPSQEATPSILIISTSKPINT